ncbi:hypothetical protein GCM10020219_100080 [Nonomuraea dietziae]
MGGEEGAQGAETKLDVCASGLGSGLFERLDGVAGGSGESEAEGQRTDPTGRHLLLLHKLHDGSRGVSHDRLLLIKVGDWWLFMVTCRFNGGSSADFASIHRRIDA